MSVAPPRTRAGTSCGPDVTDWFKMIMNDAKAHRRVLEIKRRLTVAENVGARYGYSAQAVLEGGLVRKVLAAARNAGNPTRTAGVNAQIRAADPQNQFGRAIIAATIPILGYPEQMMLAALRGASLIWKSLVETGAVFDFKNNVLSRARLAAAGCPPMCPGEPTVTIGTTCYENDLPGNILFAHISRFVGFSRTVVHLGSQYAELLPTSSRDWDSAEDTAALNLGFGLPQTNITRTIITSALRGARVTVRNCTPCSTVFSPRVPIRR